MKKSILALSLITILGILIFTFVSNKNNKKVNTSINNQIKIKIGYMPFASNWPLFIAQENKLFQEHNLNVELVQFTSGTDAINALAKGEVSSMVVNTLTDIFNLESRSPGLIKIYAMQQSTSNMNHTDTLLVKKDSELLSLNDLSGKRIGVNPGTFATTMMKIVFEKEGVTNPESVIFIPLAPNLQLQALESGQIDALVAYEPTRTLALEKNIAQVLIEHPFEYVIDPFPNVAYTLSAKLIDENPKAAKAIVSAIEKAIGYGKQNPEEVNAATSKYVSIPINIVEKLRLPEQVRGKEINKQRVQQVANLFFENGIVTKKIETSKLFYNLNENNN